jgi:hypothetical protein
MLCKHMPSNSPEYIKANKEYWDNPRERERRKLANRNRRAKWLYGKWRDKEIDHIDNNPMNNAPSNLRVISRTANRRKWAMKANRWK